MASSSSAVQPVQQQARRSGKKTVEYERTKACMTNFTKTITVIGAVPSLRRQFVQATWLGIEADSTADQLFAQALIRIENDASQFAVFCDMLGEIEGADQILDNLKVTQDSGDGFVSGSVNSQPQKTVKSEIDSGYSDIPPSTRPGTLPGNTRVKGIEAGTPSARDLDTERGVALSPIPEDGQSQEEHEMAKYLNPTIVEKLCQLPKLKKEIELIKQQRQCEVTELKKQLRDKQDALEQSMQDAVKTKQELEARLSEEEAKTKKLESDRQTAAQKQRDEIATLNKRIEDEETKAELQILRLKNELLETTMKLTEKEKLLLERELTILKQQKELSEQGKKGAVDSKDTEI